MEEKIINEIIQEELDNEIFPYHYKIIEEKLLSFNESEFRKIILIPLFIAKKFRNVRDNHGPNELGKDIIMWKNESLFGRQNYAVVVKVGQITGQIGGKGNFSDVATQVKQALNTKFIDEKTLEENIVHRCIIVTNQQIKESAIKALNSLLSDQFKIQQVTIYNYCDLIFDIINYGIIIPTINDLYSMFRVMNDSKLFKINEIDDKNGASVVSIGINKSLLNKETKIEIKLSNDEESNNIAKKIKDLQEHGIPVEIPSKYVRTDSHDLNNKIDRGAISNICLGSIRIPKIFYFKLEIHNNSSFIIPYLEFKMLHEGSKSFTLFCDNKLLAFNISIRVNDDNSIHLNYSLKKEIKNYNLYQMLISLEFDSAISKGGKVNLYDLKSNICILSFNINTDQNANDNNYFYELFRKGSIIQQITKTEIFYPENEFNERDIKDINELYSIITTGFQKNIYGTFTFHVNDKKLIEKFKNNNEIQDIIFLLRIPEKYTILNKEIDLGIASYFFNKGIMNYNIITEKDIEVKIITNKDCPAQAHYEKYFNNDFKEENIKRRPPLNFAEMGVPIGAKLVFTYGETSAEVFVSSDRKVKTADSDEEKSLTQVTREILDIDYNIQPTRYWSYEGKSLNAFYNETYTFVGL